MTSCLNVEFSCILTQGAVFKMGHSGLAYSVLWGYCWKDTAATVNTSAGTGTSSVLLSWIH